MRPTSDFGSEPADLATAADSRHKKPKFASRYARRQNSKQKGHGASALVPFLLLPQLSVALRLSAVYVVPLGISRG